MLKGSANFLNCTEIRYKSVKFCNYSPLRDSQLVRYIRKSIKSEFVITIKFCKEFHRWLKKNSLYPRFHYICVHTKRVLLYQITCCINCKIVSHDRFLLFFSLTETLDFTSINIRWHYMYVVLVPGLWVT